MLQNNFKLTTLFGILVSSIALGALYSGIMSALNPDSIADGSFLIIAFGGILLIAGVAFIFNLNWARYFLIGLFLFLGILGVIMHISYLSKGVTLFLTPFPIVVYYGVIIFGALFLTNKRIVEDFRNKK